MPVQPIQFGDEGQVATREMLRLFDALAAERPELEERPIHEYLHALERLDRQYGGAGPLPVEDAAELLAATLTELARLETHFREGPAATALADLTTGAALWAIRHALPIDPVEPVANALALRANAARAKPELSAVVGLMKGVADNVAPRLAADLERSNPQRPWRILHVNLAITAIRTEDPALMDLAFDALDAALPGEAPGFYAEAMALALAPGIAPAVRAAIEARHGRANRL